MFVCSKGYFLCQNEFQRNLNGIIGDHAEVIDWGK